jgi:hypothetical protein
MISVQDDFLFSEEFKELQDYCNNNPFQVVEFSGKSFSVLATPSNLYDDLKIYGHEIVLSFIRSAYRGFDSNMWIHADNIVNGKRIDIASVLYIDDEPIENGTAFWDHYIYGKKLPEDCSEDDFNNVLLRDADNKTAWVKRDYISSRPNRLLTYDANYFHSKYPAEITEGIRKVLVTFYTKI